MVSVTIRKSVAYKAADELHRRTGERDIPLTIERAAGAIFDAVLAKAEDVAHDAIDAPDPDDTDDELRDEVMELVFEVNERILAAVRDRLVDYVCDAIPILERPTADKR
jgi:hypothetical protein